MNDELNINVSHALEEICSDVIDIDAVGSDIVDTLRHMEPIQNTAGYLAKGPEGFSVESYKVAKVSLDRSLRILGLQSYRPVPAMECFENKFERTAAYSIATEGLTDVLKSIWKAIYNAIVSMFKNIKDFFKRLFDVSKKIDKQLDTLESNIKNTGEYPIKSLIEDQLVCAAFTINGTVSVSGVIDIIEQHTDLTSNIKRLDQNLKGVQTTLISIVDELTAAFKEPVITPNVPVNDSVGIRKEIDDYKGPGLPDTALSENGELADKSISDLLASTIGLSVDTQNYSMADKATIVINEKISSIRTALEENITTALNLTRTEYTDYYYKATSSYPLIGSKQIVFSLRKEGFTISDIELDYEVKTDLIANKLTVLTQSDMRVILKALRKLKRAHDGIDDISKMVDNQTKSLLKTIDKIQSLLSGVKGDQDQTAHISNFKDTFANIRSTISALISSISKIYTAVPTFNIQVIRAAMRYIEISIKAYH